MSDFPGFQRSATGVPNQVLPGDVIGGRTAVTLGANGKFALDTLTVGYAAFLTANGNQAASNITDAGTSVVGGIVLRNQGLAPMGWAESQVGFTFVVDQGAQVTLGVNGKFAAIITGVDTSGTPDHVPVLGDQIWVSTTTGAFASAPASVTTVTGYVIAPGWLVNKVNYVNSTVTIGAFQTLGSFAGQLAGQ
jgi:hypothetical protein